MGLKDLAARCSLKQFANHSSFLDDFKQPVEATPDVLLIILMPRGYTFWQVKPLAMKTFSTKVMLRGTIKNTTVVDRTDVGAIIEGDSQLVTRSAGDCQMGLS